MHGVCHLKERRKILIHPRWSIRRRVRLRSGICSCNLFILLLVFVVRRIEEKEKEVESQYPASQGAISFSFRRLLISRGHQFLYYLRNLSLSLSLSLLLSPFLRSFSFSFSVLVFPTLFFLESKEHPRTAN